MLIAPVACVGKKDATPPAATDAKLKSDVAALQTSVASLQGVVSNLEKPPNYEPDIKALKQQVTDLETANSDLEGRIAELEAGSPNTNGDGDIEYVTTRWSPNIELENTESGKVVIVDIGWYPTRIKDEDTYRITFDIDNDSGAIVTNEVLYIVFAPSSRDTNIDTKNTGMFSTKPINIWWDVDYNPSSGVECKRIEFISDPFTLQEGLTPVTIEFDLYYER